MKRYFFLFSLAAIVILPLTGAAAQQEQPSASFEVLSTWTYHSTFITSKGINDDGTVVGTFIPANGLENGYIGNRREGVTETLSFSPMAPTFP